MYLNRSFHPVYFVSFFAYTTPCLPALPSCSLSLLRFRFSVTPLHPSLQWFFFLPTPVLPPSLTKSLLVNQGDFLDWGLIILTFIWAGNKTFASSQVFFSVKIANSLKNVSEGPFSRSAPTFTCQSSLQVFSNLSSECLWHWSIPVTNSVVGYWTFPCLVTLSCNWTMQLRRLFIQHHCRTLGGFPINWVPLSTRVSYRMSRDRGERRTDPAGLRAGFYSRRHAGWRIET